MKTKTIIYTLLLLLVTAVTLSSCNVSATEEPALPPAPDPIEILEGQVESERQLRMEAEIKAADEAQLRDHWELIALGLGILSIAGFFIGIAIGSNGDRHATVSV